MSNYYQFEPQVNDFGDNYHKSDEEIYAGLETEIRSLKRKYRKYSEYVTAIRIIERYMAQLIIKYGGEQNLKDAIELGTCQEYIPHIPRYRKTAENELCAKFGIILSEQEDEMDFSFDDDGETEAAIENASSECGNGMDLVRSHCVYLPFELSKETNKVLSDQDEILKELETIHNYSLLNQSRASSKKKKKKSKHNIDKEIKRRKKDLKRAMRERTAGELVQDWNMAVVTEKMYPMDDQFCVYKGITITQSDYNDAKFAEALVALGIADDTDSSLYSSKKLRKMVKATKKKKKKVKEAVDMDEFMDAYNGSDEFGANFAAFEREMLAFDQTTMRRAMEDEED